MKERNKTSIIVAVIGLIATIVAAVLGNIHGTSQQNQYIQSQIANVDGDNNTVNINDVDDLVNEYNRLTSENKSLVSQNAEYFDDLKEEKERVEELENNTDSRIIELEQLLKDKPDVQFKNIGLAIEGEDIPINSTNSLVIINNRTYYSDEFVKNLISSDTNMTIQNDIMYIGKIIKEKSYLSDEWIFDRSGVDLESSLTDSYGNVHTNALEFYSTSSSITYSLSNEYSLLKCNLSISKNANVDSTGIITIKADDVIIYTSPVLTKTTKPFNVEDIPINNCSLLTIQYNTDYYNNNVCIMSDIIIYN